MIFNKRMPIKFRIAVRSIEEKFNHLWFKIKPYVEAKKRSCWVSAKSISFDKKDNDKASDYFRMMQIVKDAGLKDGVKLNIPEAMYLKGG